MVPDGDQSLRDPPDQSHRRRLAAGVCAALLLVTGLSGGMGRGGGGRVLHAAADDGDESAMEVEEVGESAMSTQGADNVMFETYCADAYNHCRGHEEEHNPSRPKCPQTDEEGTLGCKVCIQKEFQQSCDIGGKNLPCHKKDIADHSRACYQGLAACELKKACYSTLNSMLDTKHCLDCLMEHYMDYYNNYASVGKVIPGESEEYVGDEIEVDHGQSGLDEVEAALEAGLQ